MGAGGHLERCLRPIEVRETAARVRRWVTVPETCESCQKLPAVVLRNGEALCGRCRIERESRESLAPAGAWRADPDPDDEPEPSAFQFRGLAIVFNAPSVDLGFIEVIRPSAVDRNATERIDTAALWSHNQDDTLGRLSAGTLRTRKTSAGLAVMIDLPRWATPYVETVRRRDVTGMSFAFDTITDEWWTEDGNAHRAIVDMRYYEVSAVTFPAYPQTRLTVAKPTDPAAWWREAQTGEQLRLVG
jgi:HK97 family phage prohead protease